MTRRPSTARPRARRGVAIAIVALLLGRASIAAAASVFVLADRSTVVVRGVVDRVQSYKDDAFLVFTITPRAVLKGTASVGTPIDLVEERVFGSERPYFAAGTETLIFAVPLPPYAYYQQALPQRSYLRWTEHNDSAADIAPLADPAVAAAVTDYLAVHDDPPVLARHLATLLASPSPRLRADALATITARGELAATLDAAALEPVRRVLAADQVPEKERGAVLMALASAGAPGAAALAEHLAAAPGPLQAAGVNALVVVGRVPPEDKLLPWSRSKDPAMRSAAVRGLAQLTSRAALDRVSRMVADDTDPQVRLAALQGLAASTDPRAVAIAAKAMRGSSKEEVLAAADALRRIGSPEAVHALGAVLRDGSFDAAAAAALALGQCNDRNAKAILREQRDIHPNPQVRRVIKLALGEKLEEHED